MNSNVLDKCFLYLISVTFISCENIKNNNTTSIGVNKIETVSKIDYVVRNYYPHDTSSFTEGLIFKDGILFESTGSPEELPNTRSFFGSVNLKTGHISKKVELDITKYFGEGISCFDGKLYQLTYKNQVGFIYSSKNYLRIGSFKFASLEGWGLTTIDTLLVMSDGTNKLTFLDPKREMKMVKQIEVFENDIPTSNLNELEFIKGYIYANVFTTTFIVKIDPFTGKVVGKLDLSIVAQDAKSRYNNSLEMNGIAYDSLSNKVMITGKMWPLIYELEFAK